MTKTRLFRYGGLALPLVLNLWSTPSNASDEKVVHGAWCRPQTSWVRGGANGWLGAGSTFDGYSERLRFASTPFETSQRVTAICPLVRDNVHAALSGLWVRLWGEGGTASCRLWSVSTTGYTGGYDVSSSVTATRADGPVSRQISTTGVTHYDNGSYAVECDSPTVENFKVYGIKWQELD
jgi:hypothetical protein